MEAFSFSSSSALLPTPSNRRSHSVCPRSRLAVVAAAGGDNYRCGFGRRSIVEEDMVVLRKRIRDLEMVEGGDEDRMVPAPEGWMEWEKQYYYERYDTGVCAAAAELEGALRRTRPLVALGLVGLVVVSVPTTGFIALAHLVDLVKLIISLWG